MQWCPWRSLQIADTGARVQGIVGHVVCISRWEDEGKNPWRIWLATKQQKLFSFFASAAHPCKEVLRPIVLNCGRMLGDVRLCNLELAALPSVRVAVEADSVSYVNRNTSIESIYAG